MISHAIEVGYQAGLLRGIVVGVTIFAGTAVSLGITMKIRRDHTLELRPGELIGYGLGILTVVTLATWRGWL